MGQALSPANQFIHIFHWVPPGTPWGAKMEGMSESLVEPVELGLARANVDLPGWQKTISSVAALLLAILFFASGAGAVG